MAYEDYRMSGILGQDRETLKRALDDPSLTESQRQAITMQHNIYNGVLASANPFADNYGGTKPVQPSYGAVPTPEKKGPTKAQLIRKRDKLREQYADLFERKRRYDKTLFFKKRYALTPEETKLYRKVLTEICDINLKLDDMENGWKPSKNRSKADKEDDCSCFGSGGCY